MNRVGGMMSAPAAAQAHRRPRLLTRHCVIRRRVPTSSPAVFSRVLGVEWAAGLNLLGEKMGSEGGGGLSSRRIHVLRATRPQARARQSGRVRTRHNWQAR